jgi:hypothetical protein
MNEERPLSVHTMLFGPSRPEEGLNELLGATAVMTNGDDQVSPALAQAADSRLAQVATPLLDVDIGEVVRAGLAKHRSLVGAAQRSMASPGSEEAVELATHTITSVHEPRVDVYVDEKLLSSIHFTLSLTIVVRALLGIVRAGVLVALQSGDATVTATLLCEGTQLVSRSRDVDLPAVLDVGVGIQLIPAANAVP